MVLQLTDKIAPIARAPSRRKQRILAEAERAATERDKWIARNRYFYEEDRRYMRFLVPAGERILDLGCGTGDLLHGLDPSEGVGVDFNSQMIAIAAAKFGELRFHEADVEQLAAAQKIAGRFDTIIMSDTVGSLDDCLATFQSLHRFCHSQTRLIVSYYSRLWEPIFAFAAKLGLKQSIQPQNWLSTKDIANLLELADFEVVKREWRVLAPWRCLGLGRLINKYVATLPIVRKFCMRNYVVARPRRRYKDLSVTVVVPCRNEKGNIVAAVSRMPRFCDDLEIIFVEGGSADGTWNEIQRVIAANPNADIKASKQSGKGKADAVRKGFAEARGDVLMILDADLTVPPEDLPKFYAALIEGKGEFVNGTRLVYPMEKLAMRTLNLVANHWFSLLFSYLLNQRYTDTLCGTKVLLRRDYERIAANRAYFGDFDPFGDFDLIFGASKLNLKTVEIPIRYTSRDYGETQISRFSHGWLLLKMVLFAFRRFKAF